jgi:organic radical activating enzyme
MSKDSNYGNAREHHPKSFRRVILWGAAQLGYAVLDCLNDEGIEFAGFWDLRHEVMGRDEVAAPYSGGFEEDTLVILCIGNTILQPELLKGLALRGYSSLLGDLVYQDLGCMLTPETGVDADQCLRGCCRAIYCRRLMDIVKAQCPPKADPPLFLDSVTIVVNQVCTLSCKYCTSYMNQYPADHRINFPTDRMIESVKAFFEAVDGVGTVTVMGGEPFLHSGLSYIVQAILDAGNFGVISISTSGTAMITEAHLPALYDPRVNVSFSNYLSSLSDHQKNIFHRNTNFLDEKNVQWTMGEPGPFWIIPSTLNAEVTSEETLIKRKQDCAPVRHLQIKDDHIYPCDFINAVHGLELAYYGDSVLRIDADTSLLRRQIMLMENQESYRACERCKGNCGSTSAAGEQGYIDMRGDK